MQDQSGIIIVSLGGLILTSTIAIVGLILAQSRAIRSELRGAARERTELRTQFEDLRKHVDIQIGELRDRLGRIEGRLPFVKAGGKASK